MDFILIKVCKVFLKTTNTTTKCETSNGRDDRDCTKQREQINLLWLFGGLLFSVFRKKKVGVVNESCLRMSPCV